MLNPNKIKKEKKKHVGCWKTQSFNFLQLSRSKLLQYNAWLKSYDLKTTSFWVHIIWFLENLRKVQVQQDSNVSNYLNFFVLNWQGYKLLY